MNGTRQLLENLHNKIGPISEISQKYVVSVMTRRGSVKLTDLDQALDDTLYLKDPAEKIMIETGLEINIFTFITIIYKAYMTDTIRDETNMWPMVCDFDMNILIDTFLKFKSCKIIKMKTQADKDIVDKLRKDIGGAMIHLKNFSELVNRLCKIENDRDIERYKTAMANIKYIIDSNPGYFNELSNVYKECEEYKN